jgi:flagellar biosynthesis/type III secretory pathway protein FliH
MEKKYEEIRRHSKTLLKMVADRDNTIAELKDALEKQLADKDLRRGIIQGQSEVIDDLRSQLETPISFDND